MSHSSSAWKARKSDFSISQLPADKRDLLQCEQEALGWHKPTLKCKSRQQQFQNMWRIYKKWLNLTYKVILWPSCVIFWKWLFSKQQRLINQRGNRDRNLPPPPPFPIVFLNSNLSFWVVLEVHCAWQKENNQGAAAHFDCETNALNWHLQTLQFSKETLQNTQKADKGSAQRFGMSKHTPDHISAC